MASKTTTEGTTTESTESAEAMELVWEEPPATQRNGKAEKLHDALVANKGKWAKYPASSSAAFAFKRRFPDVEVTTRNGQAYVGVGVKK